MINCVCLGGWKPNLWNNYPQHRLEHVKEVPTFDKELTSKFFDPVKLARNKKMDDRINKLFNMKEAVDG